jgi:acyl-CoA thioester hydrolase
MLQKETKIRVRYGETDQMGYVYYGNYAEYYEVGRVEALRELGFSYKEIEERGILMPVIDLHIQYKKPAYYDDELRIVTSIKELPNVRITFDYECYNEKNELINIGKVTLVFMDKHTGKISAPPEWFLSKIKKYFE